MDGQEQRAQEWATTHTLPFDRRATMDGSLAPQVSYLLFLLL